MFDNEFENNRKDLSQLATLSVADLFVGGKIGLDAHTLYWQPTYTQPQPTLEIMSSHEHWFYILCY